jgi:hypothetical protein
MHAKILLELTMEEAAAIVQLIGNSSREELRRKLVSETRIEMLLTIFNQMPAFGPPPILQNSNKQS